MSPILVSAPSALLHAWLGRESLAFAGLSQRSCEVSGRAPTALLAPV